jgi:hypothetical protein
MKKYLLGLTAVVFAIAISAFTKPELRVDKYSFQYKAPSGSFSEANVESLSTASWGFGTLVTASDDFILGCDQTATLEKACEIIVDPTETFLQTDGKRRLRVPADGGSVITIVAIDADPLQHANTYMVDDVNSPTIDGVDNKKF